MGARSSLQKRTQREPLKPSCPEESTGTGPSRSAPAGRPPPWNASLIDCRPLSAVMPQPNALGSPMISMEAFVRSRRSNTFLWSRSQSGPGRSVVPVAAWFKSRSVERSPRLQASFAYAVNTAAKARVAKATRQASTRARPTPIHGARDRVMREVVAHSVIRPGGQQGHRLWPGESWTSSPVCGLVGPQAANWQPENAARVTISRFMRRTCPGRRLRGRTGPGRRAPMPPR